MKSLQNMLPEIKEQFSLDRLEWPCHIYLYSIIINCRMFSSMFVHVSAILQRNENLPPKGIYY